MLLWWRYFFWTEVCYMKSCTHYDFTWYHWTKFCGAWYQVAVTAIYLDLLYLYVTFKEHGSIVFFYLSKLLSSTCSCFFKPVKCDTSSFTVVSYTCYKINGISVTWYQVSWCSRGPPKFIISSLSPYQWEQKVDNLAVTIATFMK